MSQAQRSAKAQAERDFRMRRLTRITVFIVGGAPWVVIGLFVFAARTA